MSKNKSYFHETSEQQKELVVPVVLLEFLNYKTNKVISKLLECIRCIHSSYSNKCITQWTKKPKKIIASLSIIKPFGCSDLFSIIKSLGDNVYKDIKVVCRKEIITLEIPNEYFKENNNTSINPIDVFFKGKIDTKSKNITLDPMNVIKSMKRSIVSQIPNKEHRELLMNILEPMMNVEKGMFVNAKYESTGYSTTTVAYNIKLASDKINCNLIEYICRKEAEIIQGVKIDAKGMKLKIIMKKIRKKKRKLKRGRRDGYHDYNKNFNRSRKKGRKEY